VTLAAGGAKVLRAGGGLPTRSLFHPAATPGFVPLDGTSRMRWPRLFGTTSPPSPIAFCPPYRSVSLMADHHLGNNRYVAGGDSARYPDGLRGTLPPRPRLPPRATRGPLGQVVIGFVCLVGVIRICRAACASYSRSRSLHSLRRRHDRRDWETPQVLSRSAPGRTDEWVGDCNKVFFRLEFFGPAGRPVFEPTHALC